MPPIEMAGSRHKISRGVPMIELTLFKLRLCRKGGASNELSLALIDNACV